MASPNAARSFSRAFLQAVLTTAKSQPPAKINHGYLHRVPKSHPKGPDMSGEAWIEGAGRVEIAGWVNVSKRGRKYLSLRFTPLDT